jgi:hypothetical protein
MYNPTIHKLLNENMKLSLAKWLRLLTSNHLPLTVVGLNPDMDFGFFPVRKISSLLQKVDGATGVYVCV